MRMSLSPQRLTFCWVRPTISIIDSQGVEHLVLASWPVILSWVSVSVSLSPSPCERVPGDCFATQAIVRSGAWRTTPPGDEAIAAISADRAVGLVQEEVSQIEACDGQGEHRAGTDAEFRNHEGRGI